jgi:bifunctional UDP-N-acetylglucosamine pyrophosphorylase / glucosamine-1-phosphate N-acetyltransferase
MEEFPMSTAALILAAGEGTRMKSDLPKVAHRILGVPMVRMVVDTARLAGCDPIVAVTGHRSETVEALIDDVVRVRQEEQLGTGHAVMCAEEALAGFSGSLLVLSGDTPLMRADTLTRLVEEREAHGAAVCVLTAHLDDPTGYGRIVRLSDGSVDRIVEHKDANGDQARIDEVNTGTYCFDARTLFVHLHKLDRDNAQREFYLTDMISVLRSGGHKVVSVTTEMPEETLGVNSRAQLAEATSVLQKRINEAHMAGGVTMTDPSLVWVAPTVTLGRDIVLEPMTFLYGTTVVEDGATVGPSTRATDCRIRRDAVVDSSVLIGAEVGEGAKVGPFAYLRPGTVLGPSSKAGTFVEIKNTKVGEGSKVPHLSYMGDATIGSDVNVGAGSITCNYDGHKKSPTVIGDGAFIGSDTMLVAPVEVGEGAVTGAGSAITKPVPPGALGIERSEQRNIEGWAERRDADDDQRDDG